MGDLGEFFNKAEFKCHCGCDTPFTIDQELVDRLDDLRKGFKKPVIIESGFRCEEHNRRVGGVKNSSHCLGKAADVRIEGGQDRYNVLRFAILLNFRRIGIGEHLIHLDIDNSKPQRTVWLYGTLGGE